MTRRRPAANQMPIDFDRATRLKLRASVKLPPAEKFILWIIDDHIGNGRSWTMTSRQLAEESGYTERCVRKTVAALEKRLIVWTEHASNHYHDQRREFFIAWPNLAEMIDEQSGPTEQPTEALPVDPEPCSTIRNNDLQSGTTFHDPERRSGFSIYEDCPLYCPFTAIITGPGTDGGDDGGEGMRGWKIR